MRAGIIITFPAKGEPRPEYFADYRDALTASNKLRNEGRVAHKLLPVSSITCDRDCHVGGSKVDLHVFAKKTEHEAKRRAAEKAGPASEAKSAAKKSPGRKPAGKSAPAKSADPDHAPAAGEADLENE